MRALVPMLLIGCGSRLDSNTEAELAALGLEGAVERALALGFEGFAEANSANIPVQEDAGDLAGTMTVGGQVDQGNSDNKGMRLDVALVDYADVETVTGSEGDVVALAYTTAEEAPLTVDLQLRGIPDGTLAGTFGGELLLEGDLEGVVTLALTLDGALVPAGESAAREDGTTTVVGTATNEAGGTWAIDLTL